MDQTLWDLAKPVIAGQLRTALATLGGTLIGLGALQQSDEQAFERIGVGLVLYAIPAVWSWIQKIAVSRKLAATAAAASSKAAMLAAQK
jgi:hypothetical protein